MAHAHQCGTCGRTWTHDPIDWVNVPALACARALHEHTVREHTCCGEVWIERWPPPWPWQYLGAARWHSLTRAARLAQKLAAFVVAAVRTAGRA